MSTLTTPTNTERVVEKKPALSPSRAADFLVCPLLYRFRVIDKIPEPPNIAATKGTLVHGVLEELFEELPQDRNLAKAFEKLAPHWQKLVAERPELAELFTDEQELASWLEQAKTLLANYFKLEDPAFLEPAHREMYVETELDSGLVLRGFIDRVDTKTDGAVRIVDYKTGKAPSALYENKALFQMKFYALVYWRLTGVVPTVLKLMYLNDGQTLTYTPTEHDLRVTSNKIDAIWAAINRATTKNDWRANPNKLCNWCAHQNICPEFGGTPPTSPSNQIADSIELTLDAPGADED